MTSRHAQGDRTISAAIGCAIRVSGHGTLTVHRDPAAPKAVQFSMIGSMGRRDVGSRAQYGQ
jgi:hypothetical protein